MRTLQRSGPDGDDIAGRQLQRLARKVAGQSPDELATIVEANPELVREWIVELRQRRDGLRTEVRDLEAVLHRLLDARGSRSRSAA